MKKNISILGFLTLILVVLSNSTPLNAQTPDEALRYARINYTYSTARSAGMAGSFGALGGDFSTLSTNPAGLGVFRSVNLSFTPSVVYSYTGSRYLDNFTKDDRTNFNIGNFGVVIPWKAGKEAEAVGFKYFQFGIGANRTNTFGSRMHFYGYNNSSSITTSWVDQAIANNPNLIPNDEGELNPVGLDPFASELAWNTYAVDAYQDDNGNYQFFSDMYGGKVRQEVRMHTLGSMNEFVMSGAFNWNDKLYMGATVGIPYFTYYELFKVSETDPDNVNNYFEELNYLTELKTTGNGINFKIGAIYQPMDWLKVGFAVHTPTKFNMEDDYYAEVNNTIRFDETKDFERFKDSKTSMLAYTLRTPMRLMGNLGLVIGKMGALNIDYTFQDYSNAMYRHKSFSFDETNELIYSNYGKTHSLNIGTEWLLGVMRVRAGYGFETSPYKSKQVNTGGLRQHISGGLGMNFTRFYTDVAYVYNTESTDFYPYDRAYAPVSQNKYIKHQILWTLGFRF